MKREKSSRSLRFSARQDEQFVVEVRQDGRFEAGLAVGGIEEDPGRMFELGCVVNGG